MANVFIRATVPEELFNAFLQHVRDFDAKNPGCHFEVCADMPDMPMAEMVERLRVEPALKFVDFFQRRAETIEEMAKVADAEAARHNIQGGDIFSLTTAERIADAQRARARLRPPNFDSLSSQEQWAIDKELGILDWDGK